MGFDAYEKGQVINGKIYNYVEKWSMSIAISLNLIIQLLLAHDFEYEAW